MDKSPRPKARPMKSSPRPKARPEGLKEEADLMRAMGNAQKRERADANAAKKMAKGGAVHKMPNGTMMKGKSHGMAMGGKISEYGGKENYKSKAAMAKHERAETPAKERKESRTVTGERVRGMGAATKGGNFTKNG